MVRYHDLLQWPSIDHHFSNRQNGSIKQTSNIVDNRNSATTCKSNIGAGLQIIHKWTNLTLKSDYGTRQVWFARSESTHYSHIESAIRQQTSIESKQSIINWSIPQQASIALAHWHRSRCNTAPSDNLHKQVIRINKEQYAQHKSQKTTQQLSSTCWGQNCTDETAALHHMTNQLHHNRWRVSVLAGPKQVLR